MPVTREAYSIRVQTDRNLGAEEFVRGFVTEWLTGNPKLRPERFGRGEPVKKSIEDLGIERVIAEAPALMFKRVSAPKFVADVSWRHEKGKDPRPYPWGIKVWLDGKAGDPLAMEFFKFLIHWFEPAFGSVSTTTDADRKHFVKYPFYKDGKQIGTAEQYVGVDVGATFPGVYWLTYLGPTLIDHASIEKLGDRVVARDSRGGCIIRAYEKSADAGSESARTKEKEIADCIGRERLFDVQTWIPPLE